MTLLVVVEALASLFLVAVVCAAVLGVLDTVPPLPVRARIPGGLVYGGDPLNIGDLLPIVETKL